MAIIAHIEGFKLSPVDLTKHSCPLCSYEWYELTDAPDYPYYCPGCGEPYSPLGSDVYAEMADNLTSQEDVKKSFDEIADFCRNEILQALEDYHSRKPMAYVMGEDEDGNPKEYPDTEDWDSLDKPKGPAVKLLDCLIGVIGYFRAKGVDVAKIMRKKRVMSEWRRGCH